MICGTRNGAWAGRLRVRGLITMHFLMNSPVQQQRIYVGKQGVEKIFSKTLTLSLIKFSASHQVIVG